MSSQRQVQLPSVENALKSKQNDEHLKFNDAYSIVRHCFFAGIATTTGQTFAMPFDVMKVRMQVQGLGKTLRPEERKYKGVIQSLRLILKEEGVVGWFSAWRVSAVREMWYSGMRVGLYEPAKQFIGATDPAHTPLHLKIGAGCISGFISSSLSNPLDLLKVRYMAAQGEEKRLMPSQFRAFINLYQEGGFRAYMRGYHANCARAMLITATQLPSYDHAKHVILNYDLMKEGAVLHFVCSMIASVIAIGTTNPVDVIKTRMMNFPSTRGNMACAMSVVREEGPLAFYKGSFNAWLRMGPLTIITFCMFELLRFVFGVQPI